MKRLVFALLLASSPAWAITAVLQNQQMVTTVTGQMAWQCTYSIPGGPTFTRLFQGSCPSTIEVQ